MNAKEATIHLALLGMYADNALTEPENALIDTLMTRMGWENDTGVRSAFVGQAFATVRSLHGDDEAVMEFLKVKIKPALPTDGDKKLALAELESVLKTDGNVPSSENDLLSLASWILK